MEKIKIIMRYLYYEKDRQREKEGPKINKGGEIGSKDK